MFAVNEVKSERIVIKYNGRLAIQSQRANKNYIADCSKAKHTIHSIKLAGHTQS